jgi:hypothetical protein
MPPTITPLPLVQGVLLAAAAPASPGVYSPGVGKTATVRAMTFCNTDTVARTVTLHVVASGDVPGAKNRVYGPIPLEAAGSTKATWRDDSLYELVTGDFLAPHADAPNVVAFRADGAEVS